MIILGLILFALPCSFRIQGYFRNLKYQKTLTKIYSWFIHQLSSFDFIVVWVLYVHVLQQGINCQVFVPLSLLLLLLLFPKRLKWKKKLKKYNPSNIDKCCRDQVFVSGTSSLQTLFPLLYPLFWLFIEKILMSN